MSGVWVLFVFVVVPLCAGVGILGYQRDMARHEREAARGEVDGYRANGARLTAEGRCPTCGSAR